MVRTLPAIVLAAMLSVSCIPPGVLTTRPAAETDKFEKARENALRKAERGDADAQFAVASMYAMGQGGPRDEVAATRWYRSAADQGQVQAQERLGFIYLSGRGDPASDPAAGDYMAAVAESASADSKYRLALLFATEGSPVEQDDDQAVLWMRRAADAWNSPTGIGTRLRADGQLKRFAKLGLPHAQHELGLLYSVGDGVPLSKMESARWHLAAAEQGYRPAQSVMARLYARGDGVTRDVAEAARWHLRGAEMGHAPSQYQLGLLYRAGKGVPKDEVLAHMWFNLAAAQGHVKAREQRTSLGKSLTLDQRLEAERLAIEWEPDE